MNISRKQWLMQLNLQLFVFQRLGCQVQVRSVSSHWETKLEASVWCSQFPPDNSRRKGTWKSWGLQSRQKALLAMGNHRGSLCLTFPISPHLAGRLLDFPLWKWKTNHLVSMRMWLIPGLTQWVGYPVLP